LNTLVNSAADRGTHRRILGLDFFIGRAAEAVDRMAGGGLLVVPAAPALKNLGSDTEYREALQNADLRITDSAFMVLVWNLLERDRIRRLSGLEYVIELFGRPEVRRPGATFWIMAGPVSAERNLAWLQKNGFQVGTDDVYMAPIYGAEIKDPTLLNLLGERRPKHIVVTIGGGTQERLGLYLKRHLPYLPAIHCIGAAIAFLSGDQVHIPQWADRCFLGWLFRCASNPRRFVPRYWDARQLFGLMVRYRDKLPVASA
jgi:N-acetylglucosaminyldiphosphoundecaprenol N-acetyl-beta-D-mannosaminyltransferase